MAQYERALKGDIEAKRPKLSGAKLGTWRWLCEAYMASAEFKKLRGTTPDTRRRILETTWAEPIHPDAVEVFGDMPIGKLTSAAVRVLRDRKAAFKTAANDRRKVMGYVFGWAMEAHPNLVRINPVRDVARLKHKVRNVPPWSEADFYSFMAKYPTGSKERRAMALHLYTGARGCDVRHFGPQHVKDGRFAFTQQKTGGNVDVPVLDELARELALAPKDALAFILTEYGKTFSQKGYGNWFNQKCRDAGLIEKTAHGIRGGAATIAANNGATVHQLMSMFGWLSESMAIRYTKAANRKRLADTGMPLIKLEKLEQNAV
jgi:integrase